MENYSRSFEKKKTTPFFRFTNPGKFTFYFQKRVGTRGFCYIVGVHHNCDASSSWYTSDYLGI